MFRRKVMKLAQPQSEKLRVPRSTGRLHKLGRSRRALAEPDEINVARVDHEAGRLAKHEHRVEPIAGIGEEQKPPEKTEIPESLGDDARARLFGCYPLYEEAHREQELSGQADPDPNQLRRRGCEPPVDKVRPKHDYPSSLPERAPETSSATGGRCVRLRSQLTPTR